MNKKIRVLVLDDSLMFREVLSRGISTDPSIEVVAKAVDPFDARDKILEYNPDVMTCDVEMPKMNGIEFIKRLLPQYPLPVIVVSAISDSVFDAMNAGAVDFVTKPNVQSPQSVELFIKDLITKIKIAAASKVIKSISSSRGCLERNGSMDMNKVITIGASTGGTEAIYKVLKQLPAQMPGILIVQHIPPVFSKMFADRLNDQTHFSVKEAASGDYLEPGIVLVAPGDQHMAVKKIGDRYKVEVFYGDRVNGHCPSVDVLFEAVAKECKTNALGIILTGMGYDGAKGLLSMRRKGARTIGQDEESSVVYGMPKVAFDVGAVEKQVSLDNIPETLCNMLK
ncbi:MAG: chemotaxis response regulator protein-glutamate methylesterase [Firmicutes bacterium HGW-Firmicutes-1]|jgi:two-component system chemotaxis response regulator CheB|nr:MAG: chemotaxis response regulator protein-glutamate methylesterase [Firmicutes bacterium HGW-Firmicutes-1]